MDSPALESTSGLPVFFPIFTTHALAAQNSQRAFFRKINLFCPKGMTGKLFCTPNSHLTAPGDGKMRDPLRRQRHRGPMIIAWPARDLSPQQVHTGQESSMQNRWGNVTIWSKRFWHSEGLLGLNYITLFYSNTFKRVFLVRYELLFYLSENFWFTNQHEDWAEKYQSWSWSMFFGQQLRGLRVAIKIIIW